MTEENIQARIRGNLLMALSNKFGHLVLTTGNKSELAVGYCTLYGDMSGGLAVISDVPKTAVYRLAALYNREREVIPRSTIEKAPSAELRPNQKDTDTLPPYDILDPILDLHLEEGLCADEIVARGFDRATVEWIVRAVRCNEYKRRQAAPGIKVTTKAFGVGRRFPIGRALHGVTVATRRSGPSARGRLPGSGPLRRRGPRGVGKDAAELLANATRGRAVS